MRSHVDEFNPHCALANELIDAMTEEQLAECLRVMARPSR